MRKETITTSIYKFSELSEDAKEKALEDNRDININYDWWNFDFFRDLLKTLTIDVKTDSEGRTKWGFRGFSSQGNGSHFEVDLSNSGILSFIDAVNTEAWKKEYPQIELNFRNIQLRGCIRRAIENSSIELQITTKPANHYEYMVTSWEYRLHNSTLYNTPNLDTVCEDILKDIEYNLEELNGYLYKTLKQEYNYLCSNEAIIETFETSEWEFTEDGKRY